MKRLLIMTLLLTGCARFSNDYEEEDLEPLLTQEELIQKLEGIKPDIQSVSPGKPYPVTPRPKVIPTKDQRVCCRNNCQGPAITAREAYTNYIRCTCADGRVFRVAMLRGKR